MFKLERARVNGIIVAVLVIVNGAKSSDDYCQLNDGICNGHKHLACDNDGNFSAHCPPDVQSIDIAPFKVWILDTINRERELIASGGDSNFEPAYRMAEMTWDDELELIASYSAKKCSLNQNECFKLKRFPYPGRNLWQYGSKKNKSDQELIEKVVQDMLGNKDKVTPEMMKNFYMDGRSSVYTVMVRDSNKKIGCSAVRYKNGDGFFVISMSCLFSITNIIDRPVYVFAINQQEAAAGCSTGTSFIYPHLCSMKEIYTDVNET